MSLSRSDAVLVRSEFGTRPRGCAAGVDTGHLAALLSRAADGDLEAFTDFYDHTAGTAFRVATALTTERAAAEDLTQQLYVHAWRSAAAHRTSGLSPVAWLLLPAAKLRPCSHAQRELLNSRAACG
ncbi:MAG TPA: sigma factor [Marmoricola sp.]|nr:sigma factor [Marmoricola sp.]